MVIWNRQ